MYTREQALMNAKSHMNARRDYNATLYKDRTPNAFVVVSRDSGGEHVATFRYIPGS